jgi:RNA polymerase sigma factor for flagellar operon FliA
MDPANESSSCALTPSAPNSTTPAAAESGAEVRLSRAAAEQLFVDHLTSIQRIIVAVARQQRLAADDAEEFGGTVLLRLVADDYAVLRKFRGRCSLATYLRVVIQRLCLDFRNAQWGKWRPSAVTRRRGNLAILLERLTMRDGLTFDEACAVLETNHGMSVERDTLARIHGQFRLRRPRSVGDDELVDLRAPDGAPDRPMLESEDSEQLSRALATLSAAMARMADRDQLLLQLRFADGLSVAAIARLLRLDQKWLYRRYTQLLKRLRRYLEHHGVVREGIVPLLGQTPVSDGDALPSRLTLAAVSDRTVSTTDVPNAPPPSGRPRIGRGAPR